MPPIQHRGDLPPNAIGVVPVFKVVFRGCHGALMPYTDLIGHTPHHDRHSQHPRYVHAGNAC